MNLFVRESDLLRLSRSSQGESLRGGRSAGGDIPHPSREIYTKFIIDYGTRKLPIVAVVMLVNVVRSVGRSGVNT